MLMDQVVFPAALCTYEFRREGTEVYFPQVIHHADEKVEQKINRHIERTVFRLIARQKEEQAVESFDQMLGTFEIKTNQRNILSLTLTNYAIHRNFAHGLTLVEGLTFDLETGKEWELGELFRRGSDYEARLAQIVNRQIEERNLPVFDMPVSVRPDQDFYIADKTLVLFYPLYEIAPHSTGIPMFPIIVYQIEDFIGSNSLLSRMLAW